MSSDRTLHVECAGHLLTGSKLAGKWRFACVRFPYLAERFNGATDPGACVAEFQKLALTGGVTARSALPKK